MNEKENANVYTVKTASKMPEEIWKFIIPLSHPLVIQSQENMEK